MDNVIQFVCDNTKQEGYQIHWKLIIYILDIFPVKMVTLIEILHFRHALHSDNYNVCTKKRCLLPNRQR